MVRSTRAVWGIGILLGVLAACETARNPGGIQRDLTSPTISLTTTAGDTQDIAGGLRFRVDAADNLALRQIRLVYTGGDIGIQDTFFTGTNPTITLNKTKTYPNGSGAGGLVQIVGRAVDGAGNFDEDTLFLFLRNVQALQVRLLDPQPGALASTGRSIPITVEAVQNTGISKIGFLVSPTTAITNPTTPPNDSLVFSIPLADSVRYTDTLNVIATTGTFVVVGFAEDSAGRRGTSGTVTVQIQSAANDNTPPVVNHVAGVRVEVAESITVRATDPSAISWLGLEVRNLAGTQLRFDSVNVAAGNLTDVTRRFSLSLAGIVTAFPTDIVIRGYGCDNATARNCAYSTVGTSGILDVDTITVVAGVTVPLPAGGRIADAIFNANRNELYLTNPSLSRLEIFQVANTTFVASGVPTAGPQPWGLALWPRDTLGNYADTVVVANSGGTQLSIIDVSPAVRRLLWRQDLPNYLIETYKVILGPPLREEILVFDVSDRPQYVATVCRPGGGVTCHADSVFAIYSTTPTQSSASPFQGRATLRMEKLINTTNPAQLFGHLFYELAGDSTLSSIGRDTLRIEERRGRPYNTEKVVLSACAGITIDMARFGLGDSTFVRNSGNFTHALMGEGGNITTAFARVVGYTTKAALEHGPSTATFCPTNLATYPVGHPLAGQFVVSDSGENHKDRGVTPAIDVSDFISNTGVTISSVAINFNGGTNAVRADSIYFLDEGLRLKGTSAAPLGASGMDMNYNHAFAAGAGGTPPFGGGGNPNDRLLFSARPDGNIDVWDTFFYGAVGSVPVRDPIIGPLRVARDGSGNQLLFGVTTRGVVVVQLPVFTNPFPVRQNARSR
jgi:hypothetical protein